MQKLLEIKIILFVNSFQGVPSQVVCSKLGTFTVFEKLILKMMFRYEDEGIDIPNLEDLTELNTPEPLVQLIDKQSTLRTSQSDLSQVSF